MHVFKWKNKDFTINFITQINIIDRNENEWKNHVSCIDYEAFSNIKENGENANALMNGWGKIILRKRCDVVFRHPT